MLAFYAIIWAEQSNRADIEFPWSAALPDPRMVSTLEHVAAANEIFLMTADRILLHEIAHVVFSDVGTSSADPRDEEFRADKWADHWMLDKWTDYDAEDKVFIKRCLGIACSHAPSLVLGFNPPRKSLTHPSPVARVIQFVDLIPTGTPTEKRRKDFPAAFSG